MTDRKNAPSYDRNEHELLQTLEEYGIDRSRVVCLAQATGPSPHYAKESATMLRMFFQGVTIPAGCVILSDDGTAFTSNSVDVLEELGFSKHVTYKSCVHQYLSPNDNQLHGVAKGIWRNSNLNYSDDVRASLFLLKCLNEVENDLIKYWFSRNLFLDQTTVTAVHAKTLIMGGKKDPISASQFCFECLNAYETRVVAKAKRGVASLHASPVSLPTELDGEYWAEWVTNS